MVLGLGGGFPHALIMNIFVLISSRNCLQGTWKSLISVSMSPQLHRYFLCDLSLGHMNPAGLSAASELLATG